MGTEKDPEKASSVGRYQILNFCALMMMLSASFLWQQLGILYQGYFNDHHCKVPSNTSLESLLPLEEGPDGKMKYSQCSMYSDKAKNQTIPCTDGWTYDPAYFDEDDGTIVMEWDLVCDKNDLVEMSILVHTVGLVLGNFMVSPFGDRFGRKKVMFACEVLLIIFGIATTFSPNYAVFCVLSFARGLFASGIFLEGIILAVELFPSDYYSYVFPFLGCFTALSQMILVVFAYFIRGWRLLQLVISASMGIFLVYYRWCPESVRWLIAKGRIEEANDLLKTQARVNGIPFKEINPVPMDNKGSKSAGGSEWQEFKAYMRKPKLAFYLVMICFVCFVTRVCYFGLFYLQGSLAGNFYVVNAINSVLGIPGYMLSIPMMHFLGRKSTLVIFTLLIALHFGLSAGASYIPASGGFNPDLLATGLAISAKVWLGGQNAVFSIYNQEMSPTPIRSTCLGISHAWGFVGTMGAPFLSMSLAKVHMWMPGTILAALSVLATVSLLFVPETLGRGLPISSMQINSYPLNLTAEEKANMKLARKKSKLSEGTGNKGFVPDSDPCDKPSGICNGIQLMNGNYSSKETHPADVEITHI